MKCFLKLSNSSAGPVIWTFPFVLDAGRLSEMIKWVRICPLVPGATLRPLWSTSSFTLWASTTNSPAQIETTMSKSGGTRLRKVSYQFLLQTHSYWTCYTFTEMVSDKDHFTTRSNQKLFWTKKTLSGRWRHFFIALRLIVQVQRSFLTVKTKDIQTKRSIQYLPVMDLIMSSFRSKLSSLDFEH